MHPAVYKFNQIIENGFFNTDPWKAANEKQKQVALQRRQIVEFVLSLSQSSSLNKGLITFENLLKEGKLPSIHSANMQQLNNPGRSTIRNWAKAFNQSGINSLLPKYNGTKRGQYGWEVRALELYHRPQKPSISKVSKDLKERYGFRNAQEHNVRYFFSTLPADLQENSPWRMGRKQYNDGLREHISRTTENLPVGCLYQGDGHCLDVYVKHPKSGKRTWRPELVVFMDVRSRFIVGWYLCAAEASISTMAALSHGLSTYNHVPALVHVDHGSGFKSKMMNDQTTGFYHSFGIEPIFALPGNAKAKNVERFFRTMEDDFGKDWDTYCGYAMSKDASRHFTDAKLKRLEDQGKIHVPTLQEWAEGFAEWLERYHNRPHPEMPDTTPAQLWATLENVPVVDGSLLVKPRAEVKVHRSLITLHGRKYKSDFLYQFEGQALVAEYDLHDDTNIRLFDMDGRWLTTAHLKTKRDYLPTSRIEQANRNSLIAKNKRLENKQRENELQAGLHAPLHAEQAEELSALDRSMQELAEAQAPQNDEFNLDAVTQELLSSTPTELTQDTDDLSLLDLLEQES